jgi:ribose 5-phosphate isomerase B
MNIYLATDHAGFDCKERVRIFLQSFISPHGETYTVHDFSSEKRDPNDDYPEIIPRAIRAIGADAHRGIVSKAIVFGASGQGEAIVANRYPGIRAMVYYAVNDDSIRLSREHNDANVLSIGARFLTPDEVIHAVGLWLSTEFSGEIRHQRRIAEIDNLDII